LARHSIIRSTISPESQKQPPLSWLMTKLILPISILLLSLAPPQESQSIGGKEHNDNILGVRIGMSVPEALEAVFVNANRKPGQEKPDAMRHEGNDNKDIRVLYNDLKVGKLQILFANGQWVQEITLVYASPRPLDELRLPSSSEIGVAMGGQRYDDRYTVGYTDTKKLEHYWWRDEMAAAGYRIRVGFISGKLTARNRDATSIARKLVSVTPGDEEKFRQAMASK